MSADICTKHQQPDEDGNRCRDCIIESLAKALDAAKDWSQNKDGSASTSEESLMRIEEICKNALKRVPRIRKGLWMVDLPNPNSPNDEMINVGHFDSRSEAIKDAAEKWGADSEGRITIVSFVPEEDDEYCDDCGDLLKLGKFKVFAQVPYDVASANKGESAVVCLKCDKKHTRKRKR